MSPSLPLQDALDGLMGHVVTSSQGHRPVPARARAICRPDLQHLLGGQFCHTRPLAYRPDCGASTHRVPLAARHSSILRRQLHIAIVGVQVQMIVSRAGSDVARVADFKPLRYGSVLPDPRKDVGPDAVASHIERPVPGMVQVTSKEVTSSGLLNLDIESCRIGRVDDAATNRNEVASGTTEEAATIRSLWATTPIARISTIPLRHGLTSVSPAPGRSHVAGDFVARIIP